MEFDGDGLASPLFVKLYLDSLGLDHEGVIQRAAELIAQLHVRAVNAEQRIAAIDARDNEALERLLQLPEVVSRLVATSGKTIRQVYVASSRENLLKAGDFLDLDEIEIAGIER